MDSVGHLIDIQDEQKDANDRASHRHPIPGQILWYARVTKENVLLAQECK